MRGEIIVEPAEVVGDLDAVDEALLVGQYGADFSGELDVFSSDLSGVSDKSDAIAVHTANAERDELAIAMDNVVYCSSWILTLPTAA
jgi:hypothetical protein